ncbi:MAG: acyl-CoA dehydrogenase, partial [Ilumatobacteraceae bacterium]
MTASATAAPDLSAAAEVVALADGVIATAVRHLNELGGPDAHQVLAYDVAHAASAAATARALLDYGGKGDTEGRIACAFAADMVHDLVSRLAGREELWGVGPDPLRSAHAFLATYRDPAFLSGLAESSGPRHL